MCFFFLMKKACHYYLHFNSINKGIIVLYIRQVASMDGIPQKVLGYKRYIYLLSLYPFPCVANTFTQVFVSWCLSLAKRLLLFFAKYEDFIKKKRKANLCAMPQQEVATITYKGRNTRGRSLVRKYGHTQLHKLQIHLDKPVSLNYFFFFLYDVGLGTRQGRTFWPRFWE